MRRRENAELAARRATGKSETARVGVPVRARERGTTGTIRRRPSLSNVIQWWSKPPDGGRVICKYYIIKKIIKKKKYKNINIVVLYIICMSIIYQYAYIIIYNICKGVQIFRVIV